jgi:hypothetical protein
LQEEIHRPDTPPSVVRGNTEPSRRATSALRPSLTIETQIGKSIQTHYQPQPHHAPQTLNHRQVKYTRANSINLNYPWRTPARIIRPSNMKLG